MSRFFYEVVARDRAADWRREADRDRLLGRRPRASRRVVTRLLALLQVPFGGAAIDAVEPRPSPAPGMAEHRDAPVTQTPTLMPAAQHGPPTRPQQR